MRFSSTARDARHACAQLSLMDRITSYLKANKAWDQTVRTRAFVALAHAAHRAHALLGQMQRPAVQVFNEMIWYPSHGNMRNSQVSVRACRRREVLHCLPARMHIPPHTLARSRARRLTGARAGPLDVHEQQDAVQGAGLQAARAPAKTVCPLDAHLTASRAQTARPQFQRKDSVGKNRRPVMVHINYHPDKVCAQGMRRGCVSAILTAKFDVAPVMCTVGAHEGCHPPLGGRRHARARQVSGAPPVPSCARRVAQLHDGPPNFLAFLRRMAPSETLHGHAHAATAALPRSAAQRSTFVRPCAGRFVCTHGMALRAALRAAAVTRRLAGMYCMGSHVAAHQQHSPRQRQAPRATC
jgi:hypothetical protein